MIAPEIKKLLNELQPHRKTLTVVIIAGVVMALSQGLVASMIKSLFDGMQSANHKMLVSTPLIVLGLYFIAGVARYFHIYKMNYVGEIVVQQLRARLQMKFMNLNLSFHNNYSAGSGGLLSRILNDLAMIQGSLRFFADFFREPILLTYLICWLFYLNWRLTLSIIVVFPLIIWFLQVITKAIKKYSTQGQEGLEGITSTIKESLDGVRIIQSFNLEEEMARRFREQADGYLESRKKVHQKVELSGPVTEFVAAVVILGIMSYMSFEIAAGRATFGDFGSYLASLLLLNAPIKKLQESFVKIQETVVSTRRVYELLEDGSEVPQTEKTVFFPKDWKHITYRNVSFSYGTDMILKNVNLTINRGEMVAFVGASGSGKSTLVNLLGRFFDPTSGEILIDDIPIREIHLKDLRANLALVTQDVFLFSDTIERNIWSGDLSKSNERVQAAAQAANAHQFILKMPKGYQSRVGDRGNLLSGGEKQRISIARALFKDAPILILDEATSALDSASEVEVQKGLDTLMQGRTSLVIAHRLSTVAKADRIVVMKAGEIVETGTHQELLSSQKDYFELHQLQYKHGSL